MTAAASRIPNFAGIALVDILANGVAVLIIVIVLSIASRSEQEKQYTEQIREVSTVMTREFSTSLILNRLAAGPPALLHDYQNSPLDQFWDPLIMPVLEIHRDSVRDPYSGRTWSRGELLQEPNSLDDFLSTLDSFQRSQIRGDFYDVGTYYLLMSILKDHQINIAHWHFIGYSGNGMLANPSLCPPGVSAQHCTTGVAGEATSDMPDLLDALTDQNGSGGDSEQQSDGNWPPDTGAEESNREGGGQGTGNATLPAGSQLTTAGERGTLEAGSFPDAREHRSRMLSQMRGQGSGNGSSGNSGRSLSIQIADPNATPLPVEGLNVGSLVQDPGQLLSAMMIYLGELQESFDNDQPPTTQLQQFIPRLMAAFSETDSLSEGEQAIVEDLKLALRIRAQHIDGPDSPEPLLLSPLPPTSHPKAIVRVPINRVISEAEVQSNNELLLNNMPESARVRFAMQAFPDIWRGLQVSLERSAILMVSPHQTEPDIPKWRAVAYIAPQLDDLTVGFVYGQINDDDLLEIVGESNLGLIGTQSVTPLWETNPFSVRAWRTALYLGLGLLFIGLLVFWRPGVLNRR